jgi:hypothetical protein
MAGDAFKQVRPGERLEIPAVAYNAFLDAVKWVRQQQTISAGGVNGDAYSPTIIRVRNTSGSDVDRLGILAIGEPTITPTDNLDSFKRLVIFDGDTPESGTGAKWCVVLEPIVDGGIGRAVIAGVVPVQIAVSGSVGAYAEAQSGEVVSLTTGSTGSARVLWAETTGSTRWAIVRLGDGSGENAGTVTTVRDSTGTPSYSSVIVIEGVASTGVGVSQSAPGYGTLSLLAASASQMGAITTGTQGIAGEKSFLADLFAEMDAIVGEYVYIGAAAPGVAKANSRGRFSADNTVNGILIELMNGTDNTVLAALGIDMTFGAHIRFRSGGSHYDGVSGTDALGNVYHGGIITTVGSGSVGSGDTVGPSSSVASEVALFDGATGKLLKRATGTGIAVVTSGVLSSGQLSGDATTTGAGLAVTIAADAVTYAKMQNVSATSRILGRKTSGAGDVEECTLSETLDFIGSAAQGDILCRGSSGWVRLGAGTSGYVLQTGGAGANPSWVAGAAAYTDEMARDAIGTALVEGLGASITIDDGADTITLGQDFVGCSVYLNAGTQNVATSTYTSITFDAAQTDPQSFHSVSTNNTRATVPTGMRGIYRITGQIRYNAFTAQRLFAQLLLNGTTAVAYGEDVGATTVYQIITVEVVHRLYAGDYIELQAWQNSGSTQAVLGGTVAATTLALEYLGYN